MSSSLQSAEEDLAFLRRLVEGDRGTMFRKRFGVVYLVWGVTWGLYTLLQWSPLASVIPKPAQAAALTLTLLGSLGATAWSAVLRRRNAEGSVSARALRAVFTGIGLSYLSVLGVSLWLSAREDTPLFVMLYAVVVYAGQGAGWYVAWALQRRGWLLLVSFGWYIAALLLGFSLMDHEQFVLTTAISLLLLMAAPGLAMYRSRAEPRASPARSQTS